MTSQLIVRVAGLRSGIEIGFDIGDLHVRIL